MREIITSIRPELTTDKSKTSILETFQNETLRPVLKFQNELLLSVIKHYIEKRKGAYHQLSLKERAPYLEHAIRQDLRFKSLLQGVIIGHFTSEEFSNYIENEAELGRRMTDLLVQRIVSQIEIF
jgi:hypothetical protein